MTHPDDRTPTVAAPFRPPGPAAHVPTGFINPPSHLAGGPSTVRRTGLQKTRDVALTVMAVLVSIVCAFMIYVAVAAGSAIADIGNADPTPIFSFDPVPTNPAGEECAGEVLPEGC